MGDFVKSLKRSAAAKQPLTASRNPGEVLEGSGFERFEKLNSPAVFRFRRIFLKVYSLKAAVNQESGCSGDSIAGPERSGILPESGFYPGSPDYLAALDKIFIPLVKLKAACRNQASNLFLTIVLNLARLARSCRWLMPKYYSTMYRILDSRQPDMNLAELPKKQIFLSSFTEPPLVSLLSGSHGPPVVIMRTSLQTLYAGACIAYSGLLKALREVCHRG